VLAQYSYYLLNSGDRYFQFFYKNVGQADSIIAGIMIGKHQKVVKNAILRVIRREEIADKIYKDGKPITRPKPNWNAIYNSIKNKYGQDYINLFFPDTEISFYILAEDWGKVTKLVNKKILKIPPKINGKLFGPQFGDAWTLNNYAWTLFLKCKDKKNLKQGVGWADLAISVENNNQLKSDYLDTKANLLYKMGKIENAIKLQEAAVSMVANETNSFSYKSKSETLTKMKSGLVTWPEK
jgi:tetratricopeptide (TPR) repeat protein